MSQQAGLFDPPPPPVPTGTPDYKADPFGWNAYYLSAAPALYREFREHGDRLTRAGKAVTADRVINELRYKTQLRGPDAFKVNDHAKAMFVRLYALERPGADVRVHKKGYWKGITPEDWERILSAFRRLKARGVL